MERANQPQRCLTMNINATDMTEVTFHNQFWGAPEDSAVPHPRKLSITPSVIKKVRQGHRYPVRKFDFLEKQWLVGSFP